MLLSFWSDLRFSAGFVGCVETPGLLSKPFGQESSEQLKEWFCKGAGLDVLPLLIQESGVYPVSGEVWRNVEYPVICMPTEILHCTRG